MKIIIDSHCHGTGTGHAYSTISENFNQACAIKLTGLGITDHSYKMLDSAHPFYFSNLKTLPTHINGVRAYKSVELNILDYDGNVDIEEKDVMYSNFYNVLDYTIASLHPPIITADYEQSTSALIGAINNPYVDFIGHLGDPRYPFDVDRVIKLAKENHKAIEINNASLNKNHVRYDKKFFMKILEACIKYDVPMTCGSDSHFHLNVGNFDNIYELLEHVHIPTRLLLCTDTVKFEEFIKENRKNR